jgi:hypothetical protein
MRPADRQELDCLELVRKIVAASGFERVTVAHGRARVNGLLTIVLSNGRRHIAVDANHFALADPIDVLGAAIGRITTPEEVREIRDRMSSGDQS